MSQDLIILIGSVLTMTLVLYALYDVIMGSNRRRKQRIKSIRQRLGADLPDLAPHMPHSAFKKDNSGSPLEQRLKKLLPNGAVLNQRLAKAGLNISIARFGLFSGLAMISSTFVIIVMFKLPIVIGILGGVSFGLGGAHMLVSILMARRTALFNKLFPDAIDLIVRAVKSGLPVSEGLTIISREMQGPVAKEFAQISESMQIGATMEEALWAAAQRLDNSEFNFFVISLVVQAETGGNLAETLDNLGDILRKRQTMQLKIKAMSSEARASAYILGFLPFGMMAILEVMSPGYTQPLFNDNRGLLVMGAALVSIAMGAAVMFKMVRFEI